MSWRLHLRGKAKKSILRFSREDQQRIKTALDEVANNPFAGDIEKMKGENNTWRRRSGAYRIFYEIRGREKVVFVYRIVRRTSKTY